MRRGRLAAGLVVALACHVPATGLWLFSFYMFIYHASPDSLFMVGYLVVLLQLALFAGCVLTGGWLVFHGDRSLGLGLLIGWTAGIITLVVGTILILYSAPTDTAAALGAIHGLA